MLLASGTGIEIVSKLLRHSSLATTSGDYVTNRWPMQINRACQRRGLEEGPNGRYRSPEVDLSPINRRLSVTTA